MLAPPQDLCYEPGEVIGNIANGGVMTLGYGSVQAPARPARRYPPPIPNSYLAYDGVDERGNNVDSRDFEVTVSFDAPNEAYSYSFVTHALELGRLLVLAPDAVYPATTEIRAVGDQTISEPLVIQSTEYWRLLHQASSGVLMSHTFELRPVAGGGTTICRGRLGAVGVWGWAVYPLCWWRAWCC